MEFIKTDKIKTSITKSKAGHYTVVVSQVIMYGSREIRKPVFKQSLINNIVNARAIADQAKQIHQD